MPTPSFKAHYQGELAYMKKVNQADWYFVYHTDDMPDDMPSRDSDTERLEEQGFLVFHPDWFENR